MHIALIALALIAPSPKDSLVEVRKNYQSLKTFRMRIVHHNSSGLFPGDYEQRLEWSAPKKFTLKVIRTAGEVQNLAPDYLCDGISVSTCGGSLTRRVDPINQDINIIPGWEVSGGFILAWLMKTPTSTLLEAPPAAMHLEYAWGPATEWKMLAVKEIDCTMSAGNRKTVAHMFLSADGERLVGWEFKADKRQGTMQFLDQNLDGVPAK